MWAKYDAWQLRQLERLAATDIDRTEHALNTLWNAVPGLLERLTIGAAANGDIDVDTAAAVLEWDAVDVQRAINLRAERPTHAVVLQDARSVAKVSQGQVTVWEIVREFRKVGSVERLEGAFPGIEKFELASALRYAEQNPQEIQLAIDAFEAVLARRRAEYPFSA